MLWRDIYLSILILACVAASLFATLPSHAESLAERLSGKILLQVEKNGEAWYVYPDTHERYFLGRPDDAFRIMRELSLGISNADLNTIPEAGTTQTGDLALRRRLAGKILLQVEANGEAWYVNTDTLRRHFMGRPTDAFALMRELGLGITDLDLIAIPVSKDSAPANGINHVTPSPTPELKDGRDAARQAILQAINGERAAKGVANMSLQHELSSAAQAQANDMTALQYIDFTSPSGKGIKDFAAVAGYEARTLAQNLVQTNAAAGSLLQIWKDEGGVSYGNAISPEYDHLGVGVGTVDGINVYVVVFATSLESFFENETSGLADLEAVRDQLLARLNAERAAVGLPALVMDHTLNLAAQGHANDMYNRSYYAHESPEGTTVFTRLEIAGYAPQVAAENIAKNQFSVQEVMDSWMASEGHRENMLDETVTETGFGMAYGKSNGEYTVLWVNVFALPL